MMVICVSDRIRHNSASYDTEIHSKSARVESLPGGGGSESVGNMFAAKVTTRRSVSVSDEKTVNEDDDDTSDDAKRQLTSRALMIEQMRQRSRNAEQHRDDSTFSRYAKLIGVGVAAIAIVYAYCYYRF